MSDLACISPDVHCEAESSWPCQVPDCFAIATWNVWHRCEREPRDVTSWLCDQHLTFMFRSDVIAWCLPCIKSRQPTKMTYLGHGGLQ